MTTTDPLMLQIKSLREPLGTLARAKLDAISAEVERLRAERDAALADARRYRWLREHLPQGTINDCDVTDAASWDAAIDAALKEGEK